MPSFNGGAPSAWSSSHRDPRRAGSTELAAPVDALLTEAVARAEAVPVVTRVTQRWQVHVFDVNRGECPCRRDQRTYRGRMTPSSDQPRSAPPAVVVVAAAVGVGLLLGGLTAYAQEWLPAELGSLANSSGSWTLLAFGLALLAPTRAAAAATGALVLAALLAGYVVGAAIRGDTSSTRLIVFWGLAALLVGPPLGLAAHWVRSGPPLLAAVGAAAISGVLMGEGAYGLMFVADTTYPPYWWGSIVVGLLLLVGIAAARLRHARSIAVAVGLTGPHWRRVRRDLQPEPHRVPRLGP